eukprot:TRINITY_DN4984_c0_g1_i1.p1 TRINITY_DN4984_c0_g1~~TRINITY_DN4984_c0_g1_i1.p1  ORF type:complete len:342 (+),score=63.79 TRINITY_DN4984_c0_g1_i1:90-1028(+)
MLKITAARGLLLSRMPSGFADWIGEDLPAPTLLRGVATPPTKPPFPPLAQSQGNPSVSTSSSAGTTNRLGVVSAASGAFAPLPHQLPLLPPKHPSDVNKRTLVLDLDETLAYARDGTTYARPYLQLFLTAMSRAFEVVVWTAASEERARPVLRRVDPDGAVRFAVFRDRRWFPQEALTDPDTYIYYKDLRWLGRDVDSVIVVENTPECCIPQRENAIVVPDFTCSNATELAGSADTILRELTFLLDELSHEGEETTVPLFLSRLARRKRLQRAEFEHPCNGSIGNFYLLGTPKFRQPVGPPVVAAAATAHVY